MLPHCLEILRLLHCNIFQPLELVLILLLFLCPSDAPLAALFWGRSVGGSGGWGTERKARCIYRVWAEQLHSMKPVLFCPLVLPRFCRIWAANPWVP